jgi:hypothetical protein
LADVTWRPQAAFCRRVVPDRSVIAQNGPPSAQSDSESLQQNRNWTDL